MTKINARRGECGTWHVQCVRHCAKCYVFNSVIAVFYFRSQGLEKRDLSKVTQLAGGEIQVLAIPIMLLPIAKLSFFVFNS